MLCRATSAKRWRWVVSGLVWLVLDPLVGSTKEDKMDSTTHARIKRNAIIKTGVALCAPKKRTTGMDKLSMTRSVPHQSSAPYHKRRRTLLVRRSRRIPPARQHTIKTITDDFQTPEQGHSLGARSGGHSCQQLRPSTIVRLRGARLSQLTLSMYDLFAEWTRSLR